MPGISVCDTQAVPQHQPSRAIGVGCMGLAQTVAQALSAYQRDEMDEAERLCRLVLDVDPNHFDALHILGIVALQTLRLSDALELLTRAVSINPNSAFCHGNRATVLFELERYEEAVTAYDHALEISPCYVAGYYNRANALTNLKRFDEAVAGYDRALELKPEYAEAYYNRGNALLDLKRYSEALASYDQGSKLNPTHAELHNNRGRALIAVGQFEEALGSIDQAIEINPEQAELYNNRGRALVGLRRFDAALASLERAIKVRPDYTEAHWNLALCRLLLGDFTRGWTGYEWRWKTELARKDQRDFAQPLWLGAEDLAGATILLYAEQGLGDTLQFCRYAKLVAGLGAKVVLEVQAALLPLLAGLEGTSTVLAKGVDSPAFDCQCPLLSLPLAFGTELDSIPADIPYLQSDPSRVASWNERLGSKTGPRVGLVWSGNPQHKNDHNRSIRLEQLLPLLGGGAEYVSLQKDLAEADAQVLDAHSELRHFGPELKDFSDTAALVELMDVVVSVDTSVAHLAGAMGKAVWILLPYDADWRWLMDREDSPWYTTARLFRQGAAGVWDEVIERVGEELRLQFNGATKAVEVGEARHENESAALGLSQTMQVALPAYQRGDMVEAERLCRLVLDVDGEYFDALQVLGIILAQGCRFEEAQKVLSRAVAANPASAAAHSNLGNVLHTLRRSAEAVASYDRAIQIMPEHAEALNNRGAALADLERFEEALANYDRAIQFKPDYAEAWSNRGNALRYLKRQEQAVASYDAAIRIRPDYAQAWNCRGI
ncbi:MAG: tetratricopeptide repeat protein, partial [Chloroflexales bacterium]